MRHGDMSVTASFRYVAVVFAIAAGFLVWGDVPDLPTLVGSLIIVGAGLYTLYREHKVARAGRPLIAAAGLDRCRDRRLTMRHRCRTRATARRPRRRRPPVLALVAVSALSPFAINSVVPSMPAIEHAFNTDYGRVQLILSLFLAAVAISQIIIGPLSDRFGRRPVLLGRLRDLRRRLHRLALSRPRSRR